MAAEDKFCSGCGKGLVASASICPNCGTAASNQKNSSNTNVGPGSESQKDFLTTILLSIFVGALGVDRFYTGSIGLGVGKLVVTILSCGTVGWIWWLIDIILIATGAYKDAQGRPLVRR